MKQFWIFDFGFSIRSKSNKVTCLALGALLFAVSVSVRIEAQQPKVLKIGWLAARSASAPTRDVFRR
jgi:hypothetical protein